MRCRVIRIDQTTIFDLAQQAVEQGHIASRHDGQM